MSNNTFLTIWTFPSTFLIFLLTYCTSFYYPKFSSVDWWGLSKFLSLQHTYLSQSSNTIWSTNWVLCLNEYIPTDLFSLWELQNPSYHVPVLNKIRYFLIAKLKNCEKESVGTWDCNFLNMSRILNSGLYFHMQCRLIILLTRVVTIQRIPNRRIGIFTLFWERKKESVSH